MGERKVLVFSSSVLKDGNTRTMLDLGCHLLFKTLPNVLLGLRREGQPFRAAAIFKPRCWLEMLVLNVSKQWRHTAAFPPDWVPENYCDLFLSVPLFSFSFCKNMAYSFFVILTYISLTLGYVKYDGTPCFHFQFCH